MVPITFGKLQRGLNIRSPGKINLSLQVLRKRNDGFHDIRSLMVSVGLEDELTVEATDAGIELTCDDASVPCDASNLVHRAADTLMRRAGIKRGCRVHLSKCIPVGAGMGGGSSNAAATLIALNRVWRLGWNRSRLAEVGAELGSDVPFFLWPSGAIASGHGEIIEPVKMNWRGYAALVSSGDHVSTPEVYKECKPVERTDDLRVITHCKLAKDIAPYLHNELEQTVFKVAPNIKAMRDALIESNFATEHIRVTGAGSVLFELFDDRQSAESFAARAQDCRLVHAFWVVPVPAQPS